MIEFGAAPPGKTEDRIGGFAVVVDDRFRVAVVRVGDDVFLPGGAIEGDETPEQAMHREVREEAGLEIEVVAPLGVARDWTKPGGGTARLGHYWVCRAVGQGEKQEPDHQLEWWPGSRAMRDLTLESDRWVTRRALGPC